MLLIFLAIAGCQFLGELDIGNRTTGIGVVEDDREAVARRLGELDISRDDGAEHHISEMSFQLLKYLIGEAEPGIIHGQQESFDLESRLQSALDDSDGVEELGNAFEGEIFRLHWNDHGVSGSECVDGDNPERGGAVDEYIIIIILNRGQYSEERLFTFAAVHELHFRADQVDARANHVEAFDVRLDDAVEDGIVVDDALIYGSWGLIAVKTET